MSKIISGRYGGLLLNRAKKGTRPTSAKLKSYIFNVLGSPEGCRVLDLFAGSGALGIEALSRYAGHCVFVDKNPHSVKEIRSNLQRIKVPEEQYELLCTDALRFLRSSDKNYDIIFADPPYEYNISEKFFSACQARLNPDGVLILEYGKRKEPGDAAWQAVREKKMGDSCIRFYSAEHTPKNNNEFSKK